MRELKILAILVVVVGVIYWGVEPLAHSIMHPKVADAQYDYIKANADDVAELKATIASLETELQSARNANDAINIERLEKELAKNQSYLAGIENFWKEIDLSKGDAQAGRALVEQCLACHTIDSQKLARSSGQSDADVSAAYGVTPPDLSNIAAVFDHTYLAHFLKDPVLASKLWHKDGLAYPMPPYSYLSDQEIADIIAYFASIAPKSLNDKQVFEQACARCHSVSYDNLASTSDPQDLKRYLGTKVPDLSMMIRSRGEHYLSNFINDPQRLLPQTAMPRVGVTEQAEKQIVAYLDSVGDSKKHERNALGFKIIIFFLVMTILAYLWKRKIWSDLH
ncbi:c-type cytochrome [Helicobacter canis]|uniref:Cytochrome c domain-containing protein n=1 Tax=Helicobacter canis NCTC 12740 TaxID=1357399 RepID=V8CFY2_9HELI|nr:hypothetical protein HMPREF2087_01754 [Helicobacter canis NCTC 12740]